jgi:DNA-binding NtrC family response regulator
VSDAKTLPHSLPELPVRSLRVDVLSGPDAPRSAMASRDSLTIGTARDNDLVLTDPTVSRYHVELRAVGHGAAVQDPGSTNGTWAQGMRLTEAIVPAGTLLSLGGTQLRVGEGEGVTLALHPDERLGVLLGRAPGMRRLMAEVERAARSDASTLVHGESGVGKELVAQSLHMLGARAKGPLVTVDCGALSPTLVASELFGHERGAFTGASAQYVGAFERAHGGTLFLDEIGELPASLQPVLLGVLERKRFRRLGGKNDLSVDVRVVSATHRDLRAEVNAGTFRLDLYYRLAVLKLHVPPLRERPEDLPLLLEHFAREAGYAEPLSQLISDAVLSQLTTHAWPGNVRELRNLVESSLALGAQHALTSLEPLAPAAEGQDAIAPLLSLRYREARAQLLEAFEARYLNHWLRACGQNVSRLSREAGMDRSHLNDLLRKHGLRSS